MLGRRTTSLRDTGALSDSAISCAFWLMLAFRVLTVLIASPRLFCRLGLVPPSFPFAAHEAQLLNDVSFRGGQRSLECRPGGRPLGSGRGLGPREIPSSSSSSNSTAWSLLKSGNLNFEGAGCLEDERRRSTPEVAWGTIARVQ